MVCARVVAILAAIYFFQFISLRRTRNWPTQIEESALHAKLLILLRELVVIKHIEVHSCVLQIHFPFKLEVFGSKEQCVDTLLVVCGKFVVLEAAVAKLPADHYLQRK